MLSEKNTFAAVAGLNERADLGPDGAGVVGRARAATSPSGSPGVEICCAVCVACALLWTCQPPSPTVWVSADAGCAPIATVASRSGHRCGEQGQRDDGRHVVTWLPPNSVRL